MIKKNKRTLIKDILPLAKNKKNADNRFDGIYLNRDKIYENSRKISDFYNKNVINSDNHHSFGPLKIYPRFNNSKTYLGKLRNKAHAHQYHGLHSHPYFGRHVHPNIIIRKHIIQIIIIQYQVFLMVRKKEY